jgi:hypothetical protein
MRWLDAWLLAVTVGLAMWACSGDGGSPDASGQAEVQVEALIPDGAGPDTAEVTAPDGHDEPGLTPPPAPVSPPTVTPGNKTLVVSWDAVPGATGYEAYFSATADSTSAVLFAATPETSSTLTGLTNGVPYYVWIKATNSAGASDFGPLGWATPMAGSTWPAGLMQRGSDADDNPVGMVKDKDNNVYVAGHTQGNLDPQTCTNAGSDDVFLVKYSPGGERQWTTMIGSELIDEVHAMAFDGSDRIYVLGSTYGNLDGVENTWHGEVMFLSCFTTGGSREWTKLYLAGGFGIAYRDGHLYVTGGVIQDGIGKLFLAKYDAVGVQEWIQYGPQDEDMGLNLALDSSGNIYVTGKGVTGDYQPIMFLAKFDNAGNNLWEIKKPEYTSGGGVVLDGDANIYVTGGTTAFHGFIEKYDPEGAVQWTRLVDSGMPDAVGGLTFDGAGNFFVSGGTRGNLDGQVNADPEWNTYDMLLIKYDASATRQWTRLLGTSKYDAGAGLAIFNPNSILVLGSTFGEVTTPNGGKQDYFFAQYNASGDLQ